MDVWADEAPEADAAPNPADVSVGPADMAPNPADAGAGPSPAHAGVGSADTGPNPADAAAGPADTAEIPSLSSRPTVADFHEGSPLFGVEASDGEESETVPDSQAVDDVADYFAYPGGFQDYHDDDFVPDLEVARYLRMEFDAVADDYQVVESPVGEEPKPLDEAEPPKTAAPADPPLGQPAVNTCSPADQPVLGNASADQPIPENASADQPIPGNASADQPTQGNASADQPGVGSASASLLRPEMVSPNGGDVEATAGNVPQAPQSKKELWQQIHFLSIPASNYRDGVQSFLEVCNLSS